MENKSCKGKMRNAYKTLVGKPERKRPLGRCRHRGEENMKMDVKEIGCEDMDWIHIVQNNVLWCILVSAVLQKVIS
jgi:hypothetical protein